MADDSVTADPGSGGAVFKTDLDTGVSAHVPVTKIELGANDTFDGFVASANPMPSEISDGTNTIAIAVEDVATPATINGLPIMMERDDTIGTLTPIEGDWASLRCSAEGALWVQEFNSDAILADTASMDTNLGTLAGAVAGSEMQTDVITVPAPLNVTGGGLEATALRVTLASDSTGQVTVDGTVTANLSATDNAVLDTIETNTDFGTVTGGGTEAGALRVTLASDSTGQVTIDGTVTANLSATDNAVLDTIETNTDFGTVTGGGTETGALRVTIANNSTGALTVDIDNSSVVYTEDAGTVTDGVMVQGVRDDEAATAVVTTDGDAVNLRTNLLGMLKVTQMPDATSEVKYAVIDDAASGDNEIIAAAGVGIKIRVLALFIVATGDVDVRFESGAGGTALTGVIDLTTNSGFTLPYCPVGWFETADNANLNLELSAAQSVDGCVVYVEV